MRRSNRGKSYKLMQSKLINILIKFVYIQAHQKTLKYQSHVLNPIYPLDSEKWKSSMKRSITWFYFYISWNHQYKKFDKKPEVDISIDYSTIKPSLLFIE